MIQQYQTPEHLAAGDCKKEGDQHEMFLKNTDRSLTMKKIISICLFSAFLLNSVMAEESPERGKKLVESQCVFCHDLTPAKKNNAGPYLFGVVGRVAGTAEEYIYSNEFHKKTQHAVWDKKKLNIYLKDPKAFIPGTKMTFIGVKNDQDQADIFSYLSTLK
ncbi:MAG: cytochrome c family protein [Candidatus Electrothrix sp. AR4]|nr:cytochrome c family protein [Candidatus Electrothrix sp. AR4]